MNLRGTSLLAGVGTEVHTRIRGLVVKGFLAGAPLHRSAPRWREDGDGGQDSAIAARGCGAPE